MVNKKNIYWVLIVFLLSISSVLAQPAGGGGQRQGMTQQIPTTADVGVDIPLTILYVLVVILLVSLITLVILAIITLWKDLRNKKKIKE